MTIDVYWRIGMEGDHASLRTPRRYNRGNAGGYGPGNIAPAVRNGALDEYTYLDHVAAVAKATESAGFLGGLLPSFPVTDDPWAFAAALAIGAGDFILSKLETDPHLAAIFEANGGANVIGRAGLLELAKFVVLLEEGAQYQAIAETLGGSVEFDPSNLAVQWQRSGLADEARRLGLIGDAR